MRSVGALDEFLLRRCVRSVVISSWSDLVYALTDGGTDGGNPGGSWIDGVGAKVGCARFHFPFAH